MSHGEALMLWAFLALQAKHYLCDFVLQSEYQVRTKGIYGHFGGFIHSGLHILGTIPALFILGAPLWSVPVLLAAEFLIHYHTDFSKSQIDKRFAWPVTDQRYWIVFGADQFIHQLTYIGIVSALTAHAFG